MPVYVIASLETIAIRHGVAVQSEEDETHAS
jgi:hypothetical protein